MNAMPIAAGACLVVAALVAGWPVRARRFRQARVLTGTKLAPGTRLATARSVLDRVGASPRRTTLVAGCAAGTAGAALGGPVAAVAAAAYAALAIHGLARRRHTRLVAALHARRLDELSALAADLRAGLPPVVAHMRDFAEQSQGIGAVDRLTHLTQAAGRLADETGAPLADLLDRIEADARAADRARAAALAQAAGARVTALLLAVLPVAGIGLGYVLGVDPLAVLLHTPLGAACALTAIVLQTAGLAWSQRLVRVQP
jgi:tight adherence protein B